MHPRAHTRQFAPVQVVPVQELKGRRAAWRHTRPERPRITNPGGPNMHSPPTAHSPPQTRHSALAADVPAVAARPIYCTRMALMHRDTLSTRRRVTFRAGRSCASLRGRVAHVRLAMGERPGRGIRQDCFSARSWPTASPPWGVLHRSPGREVQALR